jgi:hypothetical protein
MVQGSGFRLRDQIEGLWSRVESVGIKRIFLGSSDSVAYRGVASVICHLSSVICHLSSVICHLSSDDNIYSLDTHAAPPHRRTAA